MKEDFLHYVWKFQKFESKHLRTVRGESLRVVKTGMHNNDAGPDFFFGNVLIGNRLWIGTIEIHKRASHWFAHDHHRDSRYDNVILHVVWEYDADIHRKDGSVIPTLELKERVADSLVGRYKSLVIPKQSPINCRDNFADVHPAIVTNWLERMFFERLEARDVLISGLRRQSKNNWDAILFQLLSKNFGLKVNGLSFLSVAQSLDFKIFQKLRHNPEQLEALLFGQAGLLKSGKPDAYREHLEREFNWIDRKFSLSSLGVIQPVFLRLRPPNFPTIRLAQLTMLLHKRPHLFSNIIAAESIHDLKEVFHVAAGSYWDDHFVFGTLSKKRTKRLSDGMIELLILNTVIPLKHAYAKFGGRDISEQLIQLMMSLKAERNTIVDQYYELRPIRMTALESQALLHLNRNYCSKNKCLECAVGNAILKWEHCSSGI